ncbi:amino acid transporter, putative [Bodo saltans]|uniref:Amino acid transporter, putative n=1 Tax=Bodo saltans TaxID=75058 RepID=A0A0S4IPF7_BODSA|nr:amino acid transporter, putative [Bodo saltans]|eukprot:CUF84901.1 amino acid transporter, putative [Bodo saltans]
MASKPVANVATIEGVLGAPRPLGSSHRFTTNADMEIIHVPTQPSIMSPARSTDSFSPMPSMDSMSPMYGSSSDMTHGGAVLVAMDSIDGSMDDMSSVGGNGSPSNGGGRSNNNGGAIRNDSFGQFQQYLSTIAHNATLFLETPELGEGAEVIQRPSGATSFADFSDCFRLYIASNTMTFPYVVLLGGVLGTVMTIIPMAMLMQLAVIIQVRAKKVILHDVYCDHSKHVEVKSYMDIVNSLWSYRSRTHGSFTDEWEVRSKIPLFVRCVVTASQFGSCCTFAILIANNIQALFGLSTHNAIAGACTILAALQSLYRGDTVKKTFAIVNNVCLMAGVAVTAIIILSYAAGVPGDSPDEDRSVSLFPVSLSNLVLLFPVISGRISPALFAMDVEASLAARVISRTRKRTLKRRRLRLKKRPVVDTSVDDDLPQDHHATLERTTFILDRFERFSVRASIVSLCLLVGFGQFVYNYFGASTHAVVALSLPNGTKKSFLLGILFIGLCATGAINVAAIGNVLDGLHFADKVQAYAYRRTSNNKQQQNSEGATVTVVAANHAQQPETTTTSMNELDLRIPPTPASFVLCEYLGLRAALFLMVFAVLLAVPFFDLIAGLVGSIGFSTFSLMVPALLEVQAAKRKLEAVNQLDSQRDDPSGQQPSLQLKRVSLLDGFLSLDGQYRGIVCTMATTGFVMLVTGSTMAINSALYR